MDRKPGSDAYAVFLLAVVAGIAVLGFSIASRVEGYFAEAIALDVRHGTLAGSPISVVVAAAAPVDPARLPVARYFERARGALVIFDGDVPLHVEARGDRADLVWLDGSLAVRAIDADSPSGEAVAAPTRATFLLVLPAGYAEDQSLRPGEFLTLL
jgi:hypothetical protein